MTHQLLNDEIRKESSSPPVPIKTYQWEEIRRARQQGGYPWTYLDKAPLQVGDITAETVLKDTEPKGIMSRDHSRDRSGRRTPVSAAEDEPQKILMLDSSPGSSRKLGEGEDESVHIPMFSKEISLDEEDKEKPIEQIVVPDNLKVVKEAKVGISPKGILKRKHPASTAAPPPEDESPRNSKFCHPIVEKIKHIADKTIHKDIFHHKKDQPTKAKEEVQEIITLDCSPGTERRERRKAAELERELESEPQKKISIVMTNNVEEPEPVEDRPEETPVKIAREHAYEEMAVDPEEQSEPKKQTDGDEKSGDSKDPSLMIDEHLDDEETTAENIAKLKSMYDTSMTLPLEEPHSEAVVLEADDSPVEDKKMQTGNGSPNLTITEITDDAEDDQPSDGRAADDDDALDKKVHFDLTETTNRAPSEQASDDGEDFWSKIGDHEYEPIGKPVSEREITPQDIPEPPAEVPVTPPPPPSVFVSRNEIQQADDDASSTTSHERQFLRPPTDEDQPMNMDSFDGPESRDGVSSSSALQKQIEDRYFVDTPTTAESRTDCEISTSQVDSSALEDLPLKRENRKRSLMGTEASKLQQRIKTGTGKLRTKLKTIKKPQFTMPERPKFERPKFNLPERPKFNLPERPKFNLPDRPKFNFPDRPKINLPDRPKFRLPERPKFNMPERPKMNFFDKSKFTLPERPKFSMPDRSKFKMPDRPKINFSAFSRNKETPRRSDDKGEKSTESTSGSKKRMLDFDFRTYPRFSRFKKDKKGPKPERPGTPPPGFATVPRVTKDRQAVMSTAHWEDSSNMSASTEPRHYGGGPKVFPSETDQDFQNKLEQVDKDYNLMQEEYEREKIAKVKLDNAELWNAMEKSSAQRLEHRSSLPYFLPGTDKNEDFEQVSPNVDDASSAASAEGHRRGVLEEIDNDEFFLRQKGISQDNIEVGKYLSDEIRDAFRSPVNALDQLDKNQNLSNRAYADRMDLDEENFRNQDDYNENVDQTELNDEEEDSRNMIEHDDGYYTFPPVRPSRSRKQKAKASRIEVIEDVPKEDITPTFTEVEEIPSPKMFQDTHTKPEPEKNGNLRKSIFSSSFKEPEMENLNEYENEVEQTKDVPTIPKRRKKGKDFNYSEDGSLFNEPYEPDRWTKMKNLENKIADDEIIVHRVEYVMPRMEHERPEESPIAPRRSRSRGSRTTSICDDDRTSRGAESLTLDSHVHHQSTDLDFLDDMEDGLGYAIVDKVLPKKVEPPPRPPAPVRRHRSSKSLSGDRQFFTVPRALRGTTPPKRPSRNYSTLGPSRPPRKKSTTSLTDLASFTEPVDDAIQYVQIENDYLDTQKDLQSGDVVSKMKDRPLPPPPRPPRGPKKKKESEDKKDDDADFIIDDEYHQDLEETEPMFGSQDINIPSTIDDMRDFRNELDNFNYTKKDIPIDEFIEDEVFTSTIIKERDIAPELFIERNEPKKEDDYEHDEIVEIEVSTQTDPLPDDFDYTIGMEEAFDDSQKDNQISEIENLADEPEENSIDAEIFSKGMQRFRDSRPNSRRSRSKTPGERSKTPIERPKTPLGRMSPAILLERRVSSPTRIDNRDEMLTEATLTVLPYDDFAEYEAAPFPSLEAYMARDSEMPPQIPEPQRPSEMWRALQEESLIEESMQRAVEQPAQEEEGQFVPDVILQPLSLGINTEMGVLKTQKLQVSDLDVERLNVGELQANKILVSEIEGLSIHVTDINSKSGNIVVSGIELAPTIFDELMQRFAQLAPPSAPVAMQTPVATQTPIEVIQPRSESSQETQTDSAPYPMTPDIPNVPDPPIIRQTLNETDVHIASEPPTIIDAPISVSRIVSEPPTITESPIPTEGVPIVQTGRQIGERPILVECHEPGLIFEQISGSNERYININGINCHYDVDPPERPPLPHMEAPLYRFPEYSMPPSSFYRLRPQADRPGPDRAVVDFSENERPQHSRRRTHRREPVSSSDEEYRPVSRRAAPRSNEPSVSELSGQLFRACQSSIGRTTRSILAYITSHFGSGENKKDMQMALVIVLVMLAGLILMGVGDGKTVHHHHWDFMNPPNDK